MTFRTVCSVFLITLIFSAIGVLSVFAQADSDAVLRRRAELQKELNQIEEEIAEQQTILDAKRTERVSLERDVAILNASIEKSRLAIRARDLAIQKLGTEIVGKEETIDELSAKLLREKDSLAQLIRKTNELDDISLVEVILSTENLSDFFVDFDTFDVIKGELQASFRDIEDTKAVTHNEKQNLETRRAEEVELRTLQELEKQKIEEQEREKKLILNVTKGQETAYQLIIQEKQKTAAQIRTELFQLRGSSAIPFEQALKLANAASAQTGVRPALILGVIAQESKLGENIGNCNLPEDPPEYKWQSIMHPRDHAPFLDVTKRLGLDPNMMPLSCAPSYGYGGAMGPAQFIPSTWILYEARVAQLTGNKPANPWNPEDAFMASALLLADNGADQGTRGAERLAALRYFAGWGNAEKPQYAFYGDGVMSLADGYQRNIDILGGA